MQLAHPWPLGLASAALWVVAGCFRALALLEVSLHVEVSALVLAGIATSSFWGLAGKALLLVVGCLRLLALFAASQDDAGTSALLGGKGASNLFLFATGKVSPLVKGCFFPCEVFVAGFAAVGPRSLLEIEEADELILADGGLRPVAALWMPDGMPLNCGLCKPELGGLNPVVDGRNL